MGVGVDKCGGVWWCVCVAGGGVVEGFSDVLREEKIEGKNI